MSRVLPLFFSLSQTRPVIPFSVSFLSLYHSFLSLVPFSLSFLSPSRVVPPFVSLSGSSLSSPPPPHPHKPTRRGRPRAHLRELSIHLGHSLLEGGEAVTSGPVQDRDEISGILDLTRVNHARPSADPAEKVAR